MSLSFSTLRKANTLRLPQFKNSRGLPAHSKPDGSDWSKGEWMNAILGELGEAANLVKKIKRGDMPLEAALEELAYEFADVVTYTDITLMQFGINLDHYVDFGSFRSINHSLFDDSPEVSLGEWMNKAFAAFGAAAMIIDGLTQRLSESWNGPLRNYFVNGLVAIDCAAMKVDVILGNAVLKKFNHVSSRVKASVYINEDDCVIDIHGSML